MREPRVIAAIPSRPRFNQTLTQKCHFWTPQPPRSKAPLGETRKHTVNESSCSPQRWVLNLGQFHICLPPDICLWIWILTPWPVLLWPCQTPAENMPRPSRRFSTPSTREAPVSPSHAASVWAALIPRGSGPVQETRVDSRVLLLQQLLPGCFLTCSSCSHTDAVISSCYQLFLSGWDLTMPALGALPMKHHRICNKEYLLLGFQLFHRSTWKATEISIVSRKGKQVKSSLNLI